MISIREVAGLVGVSAATVSRVMNGTAKMDGILACNDIVAISTYKILHKKQIPVPEQIQLVGVDDIHLTRLMSPELNCSPSSGQ